MIFSFRSTREAKRRQEINDLMKESYQMLRSSQGIDVESMAVRKAGDQLRRNLGSIRKYFGHLDQRYKELQRLYEGSDYSIKVNEDNIDTQRLEKVVD